MKDVSYKMDFTRGHYERTIAQPHIVKDPFKNHSLTMESTRNHNIKTTLTRKHVKNARLKFETE
jgi:hypothetical protein